MATPELSIALTGEMATLVCDAVESGDYPTHLDVVQQALEEWKSNRDQHLAYLRKAWNEAIASESVTVDVDEMFDRLRAKHGLPPRLVES